MACENYGKISNVFVEYSQDQPGADFENPILSTGYWQETVGGDKYAYFTSTGLVVNNQSGGIIENFVVKVTSDINVSYWHGLVAADNLAGSAIRNGYVYSDNDINENRVQIHVYQKDSGSSVGLITGTVEANSTVENVYGLGDIYNHIDSTFKRAGVLVGYVNGSMSNTLSNGDVYLNGGNQKAYGPSIGETGGNVVSRRV